MNEPNRSSRSQRSRSSLHHTKKAKLNQLLVGIRSTPNATAKMNKSSITCLLSSTQDKLYAGIDTRKKKFFLTYKVEADKENHSTLVRELFNECSQDIPCAQVTTGKFYTQISINEDVALMNLLISRLTKKLEDEDLGNTLTQGIPTVIYNKRRNERDYFDEVADIIYFAVKNRLEWPFGGSFRKALGFDSVDRLITIGFSELARSAKASQHWREHIVPAVKIKDEVHRLARKHAPPGVIAEFLRSHLAIMIITREEAALLDGKITNSSENLRTEMPEGWDWGQDPLARLKRVGIIPRPLHGYEPVKWNGWKPNVVDTCRYWLDMSPLQLLRRLKGEIKSGKGKPYFKK